MDPAPFHIRLTDAALGDLEEVDEYWAARGEPERGEQYVRDLIGAAEDELSDPARARRGRPVRVALLPGTREILLFQTYRIIYRIDEEQRAVFLLRFWHSHREEPPADL